MIATSSFPSIGVKSSGQRARCCRQGFTLVEMLMVLSIIGLLSALTTAAVSGIKDAADFDSAVAQVSGVLEQARAYAMAKHAYVYVGFTEVDAAQPTTAIPQTSGAGRVAVLAVATRDGSRGFDANNSWIANYNDGSNFVVITKPLYVTGLHLLSQAEPSTGNMNRPSLSSTEDLISNASTDTPLAWPLGSSVQGNAQYTFTHVIYFDPEGASHAQLPDTTSVGQIDPYLEFDLQPTHGDSVSSAQNASADNFAAIQIDGMTGAVRVYRP